VPDALRAAVDRTLSAAGWSARKGTAALGGAPAELLDELARRGRDARAQLSRHGGQARDEVSRRLELIERRLGSLEERVRGKPKGKP
jgi:hypothetical protein